METIRILWNRYFGAIQPLPAGHYTYQSPPSEEHPYKLHLRIEKNGSGILILNASTIIHLNQTAAEYAYHWIVSTPFEQVVSQISRRYRIDQQAVKNDFQSLKDRISTLIFSQDVDPELYLEVGRTQPLEEKLSAPFRVDCALTYRAANLPSDQAGPADRVKRELTTQEWTNVLKKAWDAGIPHVVFTGGEPTLRPDLTELVSAAESLGMVTGLITDGLRLSEKDYLHKLLDGGLDHLMIVLDPQEEQAWEGIRDVLVEDISTTIHLTLKPNNKNILLEAMNRIKTLGGTKISLSASSEDLKEELMDLRNQAARNGFSLVWNLPVPFATCNPIAFELEESGQIVNGAGKAWIYLEPDSDVLPEQGSTSVWGNLLTDSWEEIWSRSG